jgi:pilus assembly protein Flp/PilA
MILSLYARLRAALSTERGATAVEYGLMVSLIAVAIILVVGTLGENLKLMFDGVAGKIVAP